MIWTQHSTPPFFSFFNPQCTELIGKRGNKHHWVLKKWFFKCFFPHINVWSFKVNGRLWTLLSHKSIDLVSAQWHMLHSHTYSHAFCFAFNFSKWFLVLKMEQFRYRLIICYCFNHSVQWWETRSRCCCYFLKFPLFNHKCNYWKSPRPRWVAGQSAVATYSNNAHMNTQQSTQNKYTHIGETHTL